MEDAHSQTSAVPSATTASVGRLANMLVFPERITDEVLRSFLRRWTELRAEGVDQVVLEFSGVNKAFSNHLAPLVCFVDAERARGGMATSIRLPSDKKMARLFQNAG